MTATYQAIAASIRQRISAGELVPGAKVPSTRAITREWGVAVATATKALAALQAEGLVRGVVGVGTVVADRTPHPKPPGPTAELNRDRIVRVAVTLADAEGLGAVTMRRLATELDVAVMSLYRHVSGKDDLVLAMADHIFGEVPAVPASSDWRARLTTVSRHLWALGKRHPWLSSVMSLVRPMLVPNGMQITDSNMGILRDLDFPPEAALQITVALAGLVVGIGASLELEADAVRETGMTSNEWMDSQQSTFDALAQRFPMLTEVAEIPGFDLSLDDVFEVGLELMLDGLAARVQKRVRSSRSTPRSAS